MTLISKNFIIRRIKIKNYYRKNKDFKTFSNFSNPEFAFYIQILE